MSGQAIDQQDRPIVKRPRPVISCLACRRKKLKCDRLLPCQQCLKGGRAQSCEYAAGQEPERRENARDTSESLDGPGFSSSNGSIGDSSGRHQVNQLLDRLKTLEDALGSQQTRNLADSSRDSIQSLTSRESSQEVMTRKAHLNDTVPTNYEDFPWLSKFPEAVQFISSLRGRNDVDIGTISARFRAIDRSITKPNYPSGALIVDDNEIIVCMLRLLPSRPVCENLINLYFENFEHCGRILHKSTFFGETNLFFTGNHKQQDHFVPTLVSILCVAASLNTLPECDLFSLHGKANGIGATQLLQSWLRNLPFKDQFTISTLQTCLLIMQSQKMHTYSSRDLWIASGHVVRYAMVMGLHTESPAYIGCIDAEVRRRIWLTILEQDLALSVLCRVAPNCPTFDVKTPSNVNDHEMVNDHHPLLSRPLDEWTDGLCQHVLSQSFNLRLEAYKLHFRPSQPARYFEVLEIAQRLERALRELPSPFKLDHNVPPGRLLAQMELDITLRRPLIALYEPFAQLRSPEDHYKESRVAWVQSNLVILCFQDLFDTKYPMIDVPKPEGYWNYYYTIYKQDVVFALQIELIELQRMKQSALIAARIRHPGFQYHVDGSHGNAPVWTFDGMAKSIEETIDPYVRRVGNDGADLADLIRWTIVFSSLCAQAGEDTETAISLALTRLADSLEPRLQLEGHNLHISKESMLFTDRYGIGSDARTDTEWFFSYLQIPEVPAGS